MTGPRAFRQWLHDNLPRSRWLRIPIGIALVLGGVLGFLPVLGFWMVPLGLAVLAIDFPPARRLARRLTVYFGRLFKERRERRSRNR
ncbi:MAG: PGPGW domain-containing protein [Rhodospirillaceae bacterium]|nr:PGPGW domain-containing protein [Rhodospirillaceae bacterium]